MSASFEHQPDWDFYPTYIEDHIAVVALDLSFFDYAPLPKFPGLLHITLNYPHPDEEGLPSEQDADDLVVMEDALRELIDGYYAGRITYDGARELFFYTEGNQNPEEAISAILDRFREFDYNLELTADSAWKSYFELLFPEEREMQIIQSNRLLRYLQENNDKSNEVRPVIHWIYFESEKNRDKFIDSLDERFEVGDAEDSSQWGADSFSVQLIENSATDDDTIHATVLELFDLADLHHGAYDGWETELVN